MPTQKTITTETREVWIIRRPKKQASSWCEKCAAMVELLTADEAARLTGFSVRAIFRQVELDQLHFWESETGGILLCLPSVNVLRPDCKRTQAETQITH